MQKLNIKSKRDWFIAFIFSFLFIYLIVMRFQVGINEFLLPLTPDKIGFFNQPEDQGVYAVTVLAMSVLSIGVMIYKKVKGKYLALALAGGIVIAGAIMGTYYYQCYSILKIPSGYKPEAVTVSYYDKRNGTHIDYTLDEETKEQIVDRVLALELISKEEKEKQRDISDFNDSGSEMSILVWYPLKNGYSYDIWVSVKDNVIRIHKGHSLEFDPIYQDNGLLKILEKIRNDKAEPNLLPGVYELQGTNEPLKPNVVLKDHNEFVFTYSALSSYLPIGTYVIDKNNLILETDDGKYQYIFEIKNNTLIFNKEESSSVSLGDLRDGSVFAIQKE